MPTSSPTDALRLVRRPSALGSLPVLDADQQRVVDLPAGSGPVVVLGSPGTGKTTTLVESVVARVARDGVEASSVLVLGPTRTAAAALRDRVTARLARTVAEPLARTASSYAFALLRRAAVLEGEPAPRLIAGPEQDRILAELLAGHAAGEGRDPGWPPELRAALPLRGFRDELRDLLMRALERGLAPFDLADLGRRHGRPDWVSAASVLAEYLDVTALSTPGAFDPAAIVDHAVHLLDSSPELLDAERRRWRLVAVDDHHESTEAVGRLLDLLVGGGRDLLLTGDPDATTQGFRGADPTLLAGAVQRHPRTDGSPAALLTLGVRHRPSVAVAAATTRVVEGVGSLGGGRQRSARTRPDAPTGHVSAAVLRSEAQSGAYVARLLRQAHLLDGVPWREMAVVVRSAGQTAGLRRALHSAGVPVSSPFAEVPVRDEPSVLPLRRALAAVLRPAELTPEAAVALVTSSLGGADALAVRRLRQGLLARERAAGGRRASDALLVEALRGPDRDGLPVEPAAGASETGAPETGAPVRRVGAVLEAGRQALAATDSTPETVLWALWDASDLAQRWHHQALAGGAAGRRADRDLDAVVALFEAAARFVDRNPGAGPGLFLEHVESHDVPADTLAERAPEDDVVALVTAQAAAGREWDLVVVAGLQEGAWPDTRLRGSLLGAADLVDLMTGREGSTDPVPRQRAARAQVLADERRLLHVAVSRARQRVVAVAVSSTDQQPSSFLDVVDPLPDGVVDRPVTRVPRAVSLPAMVGELRATLLDGGPTASAAAQELARLTAAGVPGADPDDWYGLGELSDDAALAPPDGRVTIRPSAVEAFDSCPLRWLLQSSGGRLPAGTSQAVGVLVHDIADAHPAGTLAELRQAVEERWPELGMPDTWVGARERDRVTAMVERLAGYIEAGHRELVGTEVPFDVEIPLPAATQGPDGIPEAAAGTVPEAAAGTVPEAAAQTVPEAAGGPVTARLLGRVDRLERDDEGRLVVVDLKTGSTPVSREKCATHAQLGVYQVAVEVGAFEQGSTSGGARIVGVGGSTKSFVDRNQAPVGEAEDPGWARRLVARAAVGMAGAVFDAVDQDTCRTCPVRSACPMVPEGRQVGA